MTDSSVLEDVKLDQVVEHAEPGDHDKFSHYVRKEKILEAQVLGIPAKALCGKEWLPSDLPEKYPVCPTCKEIYESGEILNDKY